MCVEISSLQREAVIKTLEICNSSLLGQHHELALIRERRCLTEVELGLMSDIENIIEGNTSIIKKGAFKTLRSLLRSV